MRGALQNAPGKRRRDGGRGNEWPIDVPNRVVARCGEEFTAAAGGGEVKEVKGVYIV